MPAVGSLKGRWKSSNEELETGNKMVKSRVLRVRSMCLVGSCFHRSISLFVLNSVPLSDQLPFRFNLEKNRIV